MARFSREQLNQAISSPVETGLPGLGGYRRGYRDHGLGFWGLEPAAGVKKFLALHSTREWRDQSILDVGAGTGKNALEFARLGAMVKAIEIDSYAVRALLGALSSLEDAALLPETAVIVVKASAVDYLSRNAEQFDVVVCYGLLHLFRDASALEAMVDLLKKSVKPGGHLILQSITNLYPAPKSQPELEGVIVTPLMITAAFSEPLWTTEWLDQEDIVHSHLSDEADHRHGSVRGIFMRRPS